ncbi:hypothetical protein BCR33DRAFT_720173 [Rhizoclosmatium globosum]|uniref:Uncharacterized protein n=1 Tax=Rhizoclosmatium globosum TaxID=329046 RepID=A0A1Y2BX66_9FUNG|nr:hypothetical protein BCR33DRAFT_720173 [Rhizoclosmatium globosum]|eukprot:ORY39343.1 hypothetical protein BCR33DRAFT_720173 [Rhizoclosmatium globosum]
MPLFFAAGRSCHWIPILRALVMGYYILRSDVLVIGYRSDALSSWDIIYYDLTFLSLDNDLTFFLPIWGGGREGKEQYVGL